MSGETYHFGADGGEGNAPQNNPVSTSSYNPGASANNNPSAPSAPSSPGYSAQTPYNVSAPPAYAPQYQQPTLPQPTLQQPIVQQQSQQYQHIRQISAPQQQQQYVNINGVNYPVVQPSQPSQPQAQQSQPAQIVYVLPNGNTQQQIITTRAPGIGTIQNVPTNATNVAQTNIVTKPQSLPTAPRNNSTDNIRCAGTAILLCIIIILADVAAIGVDELSVYESDDFDVTCGTTDCDVTLSSYSYLSTSTEYSEYCDDGSDDYCDLESKGSYFIAMHVFVWVFGLLAMSRLCKCCCSSSNCCGMNACTAVRFCFFLACVCDIGAICVWNIDNPLHDDDDGYDVTWGTSMYITLGCAIGWFVVMGIISRQ